MADTVQTTSLITLAQAFRGDVVRNINRRSVLLSTLPIRAGEGKNIAFVPETSGQLAENYSEGADAANFGSDAQLSATLNWGQYRSNFHVSGLAAATARTSSTPLGNVALWARNLVNASEALTSMINKDLFSGAGTGTLIAGLDAAIGSTTNTYATIDRTQGANALFLPTVVDPGILTDPTFALIRDDVRKVYEACGSNPDLAVCSPAVFNKIGSLFDSIRREGIDQVSTARGDITLRFGFKALELDGLFFVKDKDATANTIYYINSNHAHIEYLPPDVPTLDDESQMIGADDGFGNMPLGFMYEALAKNGDSKRAQVRTYLQLVVDRPNSCGVRKNVNA